MRLIIGNKNYSSWSLRVWLMLAANDIAFEEVRILLSVENTAAEIAKYSQAGKVPVLIDGNLVVWDSLAICEYVSERYLAGRGWPENTNMRAEARSCCAEMHSSFFTLRDQMPMNCRAKDRKVVISEELRKDISRIDSMWSSLRRKYSAEGPWLFGSFTIADCMFAPVVFRFNTYNPDISESSKAYMETLLGHEKMLLWQDQAQKESEVIEESEKGEIKAKI